jgi:hypothetical protein
MEGPMVSKNRFAEALLLQDACNPSGVARTLLDMIADVRKDPTADSNTVRTDPAVILTVAKLADLVGLAYDWPRDAQAECEAAAVAASVAEAP